LWDNVILKPRTRFGSFRGRKLNNKHVSWFEPLPDTEVGLILSISHDHNHTTTDTRPETKQTDYRNRHRRYETNRLRTTHTRDTRSTLELKNRTFYSQNHCFISNNKAYQRTNKGNDFANRTNSMVHNDSDSVSILSSPIHKGPGRLNRRDFTHGTYNTMEQRSCMEGKQVSLDTAERFLQSSSVQNSVARTSSVKGWCHNGNGTCTQTGPEILDTAHNFPSRDVDTLNVQSLWPVFSQLDRLHRT